MMMMIFGFAFGFAFSYGMDLSMVVVVAFGVVAAVLFERISWFIGGVIESEK